MLVNSKGVALLLALTISAITTSFLSLVDGTPYSALLVTFILSFSSAYISIYFIMEFLIFREINQVYEALDKLKRKDFSIIEPGKKENKNPFRRINHEIFLYAKNKQGEIDELKKLEIFRREFLADVSHELKTPIFAAQGFVHTLLDGAIEDATVRDRFLKKAAKSLDGLDMLVNDLLTLSHMETGEIKMHYEHFDIFEMTKEIIEQFEHKVEKKSQLLAFSKEIRGPVIVYADPQRIHQVIVNLISNAIKYSKEGGEVLVDFSYEKNDVLVSVKDNGKGIPPEHLKRIFERFYRVEKSRSKDKGGTGLGLAIVKHIIEAHNSKVTVASSVGKGSIFSFKLKKGKIKTELKEKSQNED